jgi:hypothetical protein
MTLPKEFATMPARLHRERERRVAQAAKALQYYNPFLDDCLRAILPNDLILLGAPTGLGKTDLALSIALSNAMHERRVAYFALEAEEMELERRVKFAWLCNEAYRRNIPRKGELNYSDWYLGRCEDIIGPDLDREADQHFLSNLGGMWTFYRGQRFDRGDLKKNVEAVHPLVELIVIDHLHYVDADDEENEHRALGDTTKTIRDLALVIGKPVLLVAHLRKKDGRSKALIPSIDDFHGSSNITKICTQAITLGRATGVELPDLKWWQAPTFMSVLKDRRAGAPPFVALTMFDKRTRRYDDTYTLGRLINSPPCARRHPRCASSKHRSRSPRSVRSRPRSRPSPRGGSPASGSPPARTAASSSASRCCAPAWRGPSAAPRRRAGASS